MRPHDYEHFKATMDGFHAENTTALAPDTWRQPSSVYCAQDRARAEQELLFDRVPLVAACSSELAGANAYVARNLTGTPVLIARQADGSVRAFLNSCRHRGTEVVWGESAGCGRRFTCPYHGWTYGTDGSLVGITTTVGFPDLDREGSGLVELACAERHGLVFVARRPEVARAGGFDLDDFLGPLDTELASMGLGEFVVERRQDVEVEANWKLIMDGFLETYHVRFLHAATLTDRLFSDRSSYDRFGRHGRLASMRKTYDPAVVDPDEFLSQLVVSYRLLPNTEVLWAIDHYEVWQVEPDPVRPDHTTVRMALLTRPEQTDRAEHWARNLEMAMDIITSEDFAAARSAQRALSGGAAPSEVVYGRNEPGVQHFHQEVAASLASAGAP
jgi:phenylpropionate dioxygenase-like ring-hydroxylating dioxygenase large terminal subunit